MDKSMNTETEKMIRNIKKMCFKSLFWAGGGGGGGRGRWG